MLRLIRIGPVKEKLAGPFLD